MSSHQLDGLLGILDIDVSRNLLTQFRIKKSKVCHALVSLDVTKSVGDDLVSPRVLKFCYQSLCGPLTSLFRKICRPSLFPDSWEICRVAPVIKKGSRSDPCNYRPLAVLHTLSRVLKEFYNLGTCLRLFQWNSLAL